jgi:exosortase/archaeosortase family protein
VLSFCGLAAAFWPVWPWYARRLADGSDEPLAGLALVALLILGFRNRNGAPEQPYRFHWAAAVLVVYIMTFPFCPPIGRAALAAVAFGSVLLRGPGAAGIWGLLALTLPVVASLQFYLGYPLRVLAAEGSALILRVCGLDVAREGTVLDWAGESIIVDAPCSGIHMLWTGLFMACILAAHHRLGAGRTIVGCGVAFLIVIGANVLRSAVLFFKEAGIVAWPEWTHAGAGAVIFGMAAWLVAMVVRKPQPNPRAAPTPA